MTFEPDSFASEPAAAPRAVWDPVRIEVGIIYNREVSGSRDRALEQCRRGTSGEVYYGVTPAE